MPQYYTILANLLIPLLSLLLLDPGGREGGRGEEKGKGKQREGERELEYNSVAEGHRNDENML